jgi:hypothetical protein
VTSSEAALLLWNMHAMYSKRLVDFLADQRSNGGFTGTRA